MHYLALAVAHHLLVFGLVSMLAMELAYLRGRPVPVKRLSGLDAGYGLIALLIIVVGVCRVVWGEKGWAFYQANPWFWAKVATFALIGALSAPPTIAFLRWRRAARDNGSYQPDASEIARITKLIRLELLLIFPLVAFAAAMARWAG